MHPNRDELIACRDGEADPAVAEHVRDCAECARAVSDYRAMADALRSLPAHGPSSDLWPVLRKEMEGPTVFSSAAAIWAALLLVLLGASFFVLFRQAPPQEDPVLVSQKQAAREKIEPLRAKSRSLESALSAYQARSQVLSGRTAGTIAYLEDGLAIVDLQLSLLQTQDTEPEKVLRLWEERVRLLSALVQLNATRGALTPI